MSNLVTSKHMKKFLLALNRSIRGTIVKAPTKMTDKQLNDYFKINVITKNNEGEVNFKHKNGFTASYKLTKPRKKRTIKPKVKKVTKPKVKNEPKPIRKKPRPRRRITKTTNYKIPSKAQKVKKVTKPKVKKLTPEEEAYNRRAEFNRQMYKQKVSKDLKRFRNMMAKGRIADAFAWI